MDGPLCCRRLSDWARGANANWFSDQAVGGGSGLKTRFSNFRGLGLGVI
jgi:hypothetical protein